MFYEVCEICYNEDCPNVVGPGDLCDECFHKNGVFIDSVMTD